MGILRRLFGVSRTKPPADAECWRVESGTVEVDLTRVPELTAPGAAIRLEGEGLSQRVLVLRDEDGALHALHNRCSHAGRRLDPLPGETRVECCSVGKSTYDLDGNLACGSAKESVEPFTVALSGDRLVITL